ncbi:hypothetical protein D3C72_1645700 [compost metagenome]
MQRGAVALVLVERILGIQAMQAQQIGVARRLGQDGRRRNGGHQRIALDDGLHRAAQLGRLVAIHQRKLRRYGQPLHCPLHRQHGGAQNIQGVDLFYAGAGNAPGQGVFLDLKRQGFAGGRLEHLGIRQPVDGARGVQDHCRRIDGARQGATARLVNAGRHHGGLHRGREQVRLLHPPPPGSPGQPGPAYRAAIPGAWR